MLRIFKKFGKKYKSAGFMGKFFLFIFALFMVFGVGRYAVQSSNMAYVLVSDRQNIKAAMYASSPPQTEAFEDDFSTFLNDLALRKLAKKFITFQWFLWEKSNADLDVSYQKMLNHVPEKSEAKQAIDALYYGYGFCCKAPPTPELHKRIHILSITLATLADSIAEADKVNEERLWLLTNLLDDFAYGKWRFATLDSNIPLSIFYYMMGGQGKYGRAIMGIRGLHFSSNIEGPRMLFPALAKVVLASDNDKQRYQLAKLALIYGESALSRPSALRSYRPNRFITKEKVARKITERCSLSSIISLQYIGKTYHDIYETYQASYGKLMKMNFDSRSHKVVGVQAPRYKRNYLFCKEKGFQTFDEIYKK